MNNEMIECLSCHKSFHSAKFKQCFGCNAKDKDLIKCVKCDIHQHNKKFIMCFYCMRTKKCVACHGSGEAYWSDGVYGKCLECC